MTDSVELLIERLRRKWGIDLHAHSLLDEAAAELSRLREQNEALRMDAERQEETLNRIKQWSEAYPLDIFPEPDFKRARVLLEAGGMTLDAISASNMRHVIMQVQSIVNAAFSAARDEP